MFERQAEKFVHVHIRYHLAMVRFWSYCLLPFAAVFFASVTWMHLVGWGGADSCKRERERDRGI